MLLKFKKKPKNEKAKINMQNKHYIFELVDDYMTFYTGKAVYCKL